MVKILMRRIAKFKWIGGSRMVILTSELPAINVTNEDDEFSITVVSDNNQNKIIIERL